MILEYLIEIELDETTTQEPEDVDFIVRDAGDWVSEALPDTESFKLRVSRVGDSRGGGPPLVLCGIDYQYEEGA